jgi:predicted secreted protein
MANTTYKVVTFKIDNAAASLVEITAYVNQASLQRAINLLDDSALSDGNRSVLTGLAGTTISINGFVNTTTDAIFGPMIQTATSVTKTTQYGAYAARFYYGEALVSNIQYSGSVDSLQTFSVDLTFDGAVTRTSATQS